MSLLQDIIRVGITNIGGAVVKEDERYVVKDNKTLTKLTEEILQSGFIFQYGRDKMFRPIIYMNLYLLKVLKQKHTAEI